MRPVSTNRVLTGRPGWRVLAAAALAGAFLGAVPAGAERLVDEKIFRALDGPLASDARIRPSRSRSTTARRSTFEVSPFQVFAPGAQIVVHGRLGDVLAPAPSDRWFTGRVAGDPSSLVVLARGRSLRGFVITERPRVGHRSGAPPLRRRAAGADRSSGRWTPRPSVPTRSATSPAARTPCPFPPDAAPRRAAGTTGAEQRHVLRGHRGRDRLRALHEVQLDGEPHEVRRRPLRLRLGDLPARRPRDAPGELPLHLDDVRRSVERHERTRPRRSPSSSPTGTRTAPPSPARRRTCSRERASAAASPT